MQHKCETESKRKQNKINNNNELMTGLHKIEGQFRTTYTVALPQSYLIGAYGLSFYIKTNKNKTKQFKQNNTATDRESEEIQLDKNTPK